MALSALCGCQGTVDGLGQADATGGRHALRTILGRRRCAAGWGGIVIIIQHVGQNIFRVLETFRHFCVVGVKCLAEWQCLPLALLVHVCDLAALRVQKYFGVVLEVHLHNFVAESEHDGVLSAHPLLHVDGARLLAASTIIDHIFILGQ